MPRKVGIADGGIVYAHLYTYVCIYWQMHALVGLKGAYKRQIHTFTRFLKAQGGGGNARWLQGGSGEAPGRLQGANVPSAGPPYYVVVTM